MKRILPLIAATAVAISLASCSSPEPESQPESTADPTVVPSDQGAASHGQEGASNPEDKSAGQDEEHNSGQDEQNSGQDENSEQGSGSQGKSKTSQAPKSSKVTVAINGQEKVVKPTDVYCSGSPGSIEHIIGKVNNQIPLIKVAGDSEFAMVKLQRQGPPEKADSPSNITFGQESVTFKGTKLGSATLNGSMVCTQWED